VRKLAWIISERKYTEHDFPDLDWDRIAAEPPVIWSIHRTPREQITRQERIRAINEPNDTLFGMVVLSREDKEAAIADNQHLFPSMMELMEMAKRRRDERLARAVSDDERDRAELDYDDNLDWILKSMKEVKARPVRKQP
jgi:hypothetical protein